MNKYVVTSGNGCFKQGEKIGSVKEKIQVGPGLRTPDVLAKVANS